MTHIAPLLVLALGLALLVVLLLRPAAEAPSFPRFGPPTARSYRVWLVMVGLGLTASGLAWVVFAGGA